MHLFCSNKYRHLNIILDLQVESLDKPMVVSTPVTSQRLQESDFNTSGMCLLLSLSVSLIALCQSEKSSYGDKRARNYGYYLKVNM